MNPLYIGLFMAIIAALLGILMPIVNKKRAGSEKYQKIMADFEASVQAMLEEGEEVEAVCGYYPCAAVTNRRLLIGSRKGMEVVAFSDIKKLSGMNAAANRTSNPQDMMVLEIKAKKKYSLGNNTDGFVQVVEALYRHV